MIKLIPINSVSRMALSKVVKTSVGAGWAA
jgi:hypothetical protein